MKSPELDWNHSIGHIEEEVKAKGGPLCKTAKEPRMKPHEMTLHNTHEQEEDSHRWSCARWVLQDEGTEDEGEQDEGTKDQHTEDQEPTPNEAEQQQEAIEESKPSEGHEYTRQEQDNEDAAMADDEAAISAFMEHTRSLQIRATTLSNVNCLTSNLNCLLVCLSYLTFVFSNAGLEKTCANKTKEQEACGQADDSSRLCCSIPSPACGPATFLFPWYPSSPAP